MGRSSGLLGGFDPASRTRLRVFAFKLLTVTVLSFAYAPQRGVPICGAMALFCLWHSVFAGVVALFRRDRIGGASLNGWDEMMAFNGLAILAGLVEGLAR